MERVAIFGSTGMTGLCALEAAVEKGLKVRALVRDPSKIPEQHRDKIEIIVGDVLNYDDVLKTITGVQGVVVVLGTRNNLKATTDLSEGQKNIVKAMKEANVEVISVCLSAFLFYDLDKVPEIFRDLNDDHRRQFDVLKESGLKYVAVFPPHIGDMPSAGYTVQYDSSPGRSISKHDLGKFLICALNEPEHYGKVCGIAASSYAKSATKQP